MDMDIAHDTPPGLDGMEATEEGTQETQTQSQTFDPPSQTTSSDNCWGYLQPASIRLHRTIFKKNQAKYTIGRHRDKNHIVFPGLKVSNEHCHITWDQREGKDSVVVVHDRSSNGTFINGEKIGKGKSMILKGGNELAIGTCVPQLENDGLEDYRFVFHHVAAGQRLGIHAKYDVAHELGRGSFATVRKAMCRADGSWYAVKTITPQRLRTSASGNHGSFTAGLRDEVIKREISVMESLKHDNICQLKEVFIEPNDDYCKFGLVLELVEGGDLLDYISRNEGVPEAVAKHITYQICDALAYCHRQGIAHRDLKPENILLTKDMPPNVKIADFGLSKMVDSATMLRTMCGTPSYLAPEVVTQRNQEGYGFLVDSWSVGVICFSMLSFSSPFIEDEEQRDIRVRIAERLIDWQPVHDRNLSMEAHDFLQGLLAYDPTKRLSMESALLHRWLSDHEPSQGSDSGPGAGVTRDLTMASASEYDIGNGNHQVMETGLPTPTPGSTNPNGAKGSRLPPRRSEVLERAMQNGTKIPEPSPEMIQVFHASQQAEYAQLPASSIPQTPQTASPSSDISNGRIENKKRTRKDLSPLSEIEENEGGEIDQDAVMADVAIPRKKGKPSEEEDDEGASGPRTRTRAKAPAAVAEDPAARRRSARPTAGKR